MADSIKEFHRLARKASFHFADDTTREWGLAKDAERGAIAMLRRNPTWIPEVVATWTELWSLPKDIKDQANAS